MEAKPLLIAATLVLLALAAPGSNATDFNSTTQYHEYILNDVDTAHIDAIIIPAASPYALRDVSTIRMSLQAWEDGIQSEADSWLATNFEMDIYVLGYDDIPSDALSDPEIVVIAAEYNPFLLFGIGYTVPVGFCSAFNPLDPSIWHQHTGSQWAVASSGCKSGGNQCVALNTNFLHSDGPFVTIHGGQHGERRMYDLVAHEVGHCLGIGHVGDALDFSTAIYPETDIMSYQYDPDQVFCVSSLNIKSFHGVFAEALDAYGSPSTPRYTGGEYVHLNVNDYYNVSCPNPDLFWEYPI